MISHGRSPYAQTYGPAPDPQLHRSLLEAQEQAEKKQMGFWKRHAAWMKSASGGNTPEVATHQPAAPLSQQPDAGQPADAQDEAEKWKQRWEYDTTQLRNSLNNSVHDLGEVTQRNAQLQEEIGRLQARLAALERRNVAK
jgi:uncharacterized small protein (DUF1192 family)